jgi:hypothetical protein
MCIRLISRRNSVLGNQNIRWFQMIASAKSLNEFGHSGGFPGFASSPSQTVAAARGGQRKW